MAVHMGRLVVLGLFGPCKIYVYKKKNPQPAKTDSKQSGHNAIIKSLDAFCYSRFMSLTTIPHIFHLSS